MSKKEDEEAPNSRQTTNPRSTQLPPPNHHLCHVTVHIHREGGTGSEEANEEIARRNRRNNGGEEREEEMR